jgi:hypothetical protein
MTSPFLEAAPPELRDAWHEKVAAYAEAGVDTNSQKIVDQMFATLNTPEGIRLVADMLLYRDAYLDGQPISIPLTGSGVTITLALEDEG